MTSVIYISSHASTYVVYIEFVNFAEKYRWDKSTDLPNFSLDIRLIIYLLGRLIKADNIRYLKAYCPIIFTVNHFRDTNQLIFWMKSNSDNNVGTRKKYMKNWTNSKWSLISSIKYIIFIKFSTNSLTNTILARLNQMSVCYLSFLLRNQNWNLYLQPKFFRSC